MNQPDLTVPLSTQERYDRLFDLAGDLMCVADARGYFVRVNPAFTATLGWTDEEVLSRPILDFVHRDDRAATEAEGRKHRDGTPTRQFENRYRHKDGSWRWLSWNATPVPAESLTYAVARDVTEQKRSAETQAQLAAIVEASGDAIFGKTLDGIITAWNGGAERLYGYSAAEMLGQSVARLIPADRPAELVAITRAVSRGETIRQYETERLRHDGARLWVSLTITPIQDQAGAVSGASVVARDITARKAAEQALRASEERYRQVETHAPIGLALVAPDGRWLRVNPALCALVGYSEEELLARSFQDLTHPDDLDSDLAYVQQILAGEIATYQMEKRYIRKDGTFVWALLSVSLVRDETGQPLYFISQIQDVGARKRAEAALREREARYRLLAENATDLISRHSPDGAYRYASPACEILLGYTPDELIREPAYVRFHPDDIPAIRASHAHALLGQKPAIVAYRLRHKEGHYLWVETTSRAVRDPDTGVVREIQCATRDIGERKRAEAELAAAREAVLTALREKAALAEARQSELERSNRELQQFASVVAHDLRTPLSSIHGYADLLRLLHVDHANAEAMECIDYILTSSARMNQLMGHVLAYARAGGALAPAEPVSCATALREALTPLRASIESCGAHVVYGDLPVVRGYPTQLTQLFQNLIGNALKFRKPDGAPRVAVTAAREGAWWRISVADDGIGLDPADAERIFGVFERAHAREGYEGTGLGLAICARIAERHGGRIWVESRRGAGATFHATLAAA